ncbi:MAG: hypothetical protein BroJett001_27040 [Chloroflexota bacterium]|nr:MAG: hypothetical protein BroJett001_27040 [Chloroflexota bacterium]
MLTMARDATPIVGAIIMISNFFVWICVKDTELKKTVETANKRGPLNQLAIDSRSKKGIKKTDGINNKKYSIGHFIACFNKSNLSKLSDNRKTIAYFANS